MTDTWAGLDGLSDKLADLYRDLHQHPELSLQEYRTARLLADALRPLGFEVTEQVGGTGVVGMLRNGDGPVVMLRAVVAAAAEDHLGERRAGARQRPRRHQGHGRGVLGAPADGKIDALPSNHSGSFAPLIEPTLSTGVQALTLAAQTWLGPRC